MEVFVLETVNYATYTNQKVLGLPGKAAGSAVGELPVAFLKVPASRLDRYMWLWFLPLRALGLCPLSRRAGRLRVSWPSLCLGLAVHVLFIFQILKSVMNRPTGAPSVGRVVRAIEGIFAYITIILFFVRYYWGMRELGEVLSGVEDCERRLVRLGVRVRYGRPPLVHLAAALAFLAVSALIRLGHWGEDALGKFTMYLSGANLILYKFSFVVLVHACSVILDNMSSWAGRCPVTSCLYAHPRNMTLAQALLEACVRGLSVRSRQGLETLVQTYDRLCSLCLRLNRLFSVQLLAGMALAFINLIVNLYLAISTRSGLFAASIHFLWAAISVTLLSMIPAACVNPTGQANEFNLLLYQSMLEDENYKLSINKKLQLHMSMRRELIFTAAGFFTLDYTLLHSVAAAATTYLVVLIQFSDDEVQKKLS